MATTLFNQWVIHSGPRIRLTATTDYYRDGAYMYYRINTYIHNLDYSQSWYGWYLDMAVYIDGQYMGTTRLKQNKPIRWSGISNSTPYYGVKRVSGNAHIKIVLTSNKPRYGQRLWESGGALPAPPLSTAGLLTLKDITESGMIVNISGLPTGYEKELRFWHRAKGEAWNHIGNKTVSNSSRDCSMAFNDLMSNIDYEISVEEFVDGYKITSFDSVITLPSAKGELTTTTTESELIAVEEVNSNISYARTLEWYIRPAGAGNFQYMGEDELPAGVSTKARKFEKLTTGCRYDVRTLIKHKDTVLKETVVSDSLKPSSAVIKAESDTYSSIQVNVSHMVNTGWERTIKAKYKAAFESEYREESMTTGSESALINLKNLKAFTDYEVIVEIYRDSQIIKSWTETVKTREMGFVAIPVIKSIESVIRTKDAVINWLVNDDRDEMSYDVEYKIGEREWTKLITTKYKSKLTITLPSGNTEYLIRIKGYATDSTKISYSLAVPVYTYHRFEYDSIVDAQKEIALTSTEVNRLIRFINKKVGSSLMFVKEGELTTLEKHNELRRVLALSTIPSGDIKAVDWVSLKNKVNEG